MEKMLGEKVGAVIVPMPGQALSADPLPPNPGGKLLKRTLRESVDRDASCRR